VSSQWVNWLVGQLVIGQSEEVRRGRTNEHDKLSVKSGCCGHSGQFASSQLACWPTRPLLRACPHPRPQYFGDAPRLRDAAAGGVRIFCIEDFADAADAGFAEVIVEATQ
jgi:hypothetical protein